MMKYLFTIFYMSFVILVSISSGWTQTSQQPIPDGIGAQQQHNQDVLKGRDGSSYYFKSWAVVIGINEYPNFRSLEYAVNDAKAIKSRLEFMGFEVIFLYDEQATKRNIMEVLKEQLPQKVGVEDRLVIYYAGHTAAGRLITGEEVGFLIPSDGKSSIDGRRIEISGGNIRVDDYETFAEKTNFISVEDFRVVSDAVAAKHILYIIDACYAGFLDPAAYRRLRLDTRPSGSTSRGLGIDSSPVSPVDNLDILTSRDAVYILTAGSSGEVVYEKSGHGLFTHYLLIGLDGFADANEDCVVTITELGNYLKQTVPKATNFSQSPLFNRISGEGEFIFISPKCKPIDPVDLYPPVGDETWSKTDAYRGPETLNYKEPVQVIVDKEDNLYVLDTSLKRIFKFDSNGRHIPGYFDKMTVEESWAPISMAIDYAGDLWVYYSWQGNKKKTPSSKATSDLTLIPLPSLNHLTIDVQVDKNIYHIGEKLFITVRASQDCYLTLYNISTEGEITQIFPNGFAADNLIQSGQTYRIPMEMDEFDFEVTGPPGIEHVRAIGTVKQINLFDQWESDTAEAFPIIRQTVPQFNQSLNQKLQSLPPGQWTEASVTFRIVSGISNPTFTPMPDPTPTPIRRSVSDIPQYIRYPSDPTPTPIGRIVRYQKDGTLAVGWSGQAEPLTACVQPDSSTISFPLKGLLALDIEDNVIIVDQDSGVFMKCDRNGKLLYQTKETKKQNDNKEIISHDETPPYPQGMAVDMFGYIYVSDTEKHGIQKYYNEELIASWPNARGKKPNFLDRPHGLTVDNKLYVYVADTENHRIKKYTSNGEKLLTYWGRERARKGKEYGEFYYPMDVAINWDSTNIYVADTGNKRIQKFIIER